MAEMNFYPIQLSEPALFHLIELLEREESFQSVVIQALPGNTQNRNALEMAKDLKTSFQNIVAKGHFKTVKA